MRTLDRARHHPPSRTVPIEVAEAWRDEAVATRRALDETRAALNATKAALGESRADLEQTRAALRETRAEADRAEPTPLPEPVQESEPELVADLRVARLAADLANVRRHAQEAVANARRSERIEGLRALAEVHDDLQRSLDAMPERSGPWFAGHSAILGKVRSMLRQAGAVAVGNVGEPFDPKVHEAVGTAPGRAHEIAEVDQTGFQLEDGTLVRPARVRVGEGVQP